ncbi:hypothetical protein GCM10025866_04750 [Naasia aerilata]|uniref:Uncharacterized protein n=1 Tax=Naasia aerilata TaxID=1162966 RepID=A0ABN6XLQ4_9MICO|nr:hypothetical protein GCM10025866_04750 [Naasia aerilata]
MVAENSMVCRVAVVCANSFSMSGRKPRSSILSASSSTISRTFAREEPLAGEVEEASRRADDDLRARLELLDLALVGLAAVDGDDRGRPVRGDDLEVLGHLDAQLARRDDHEHLHARGRLEAEPLDDRDAEAEGLARSGLGLADDVLAGEAEGDGLGLDGEGLEDALVCEGIDHVLVDAEFSESHEVDAPVDKCARRS